MFEFSDFMLNDKKKREGDNPSLFYFVARNPAVFDSLLLEA
jgi:hypothetical protein